MRTRRRRGKAKNILSILLIDFQNTAAFFSSERDPPFLTELYICPQMIFSQTSFLWIMKKAFSGLSRFLRMRWKVSLGWDGRGWKTFRAICTAPDFRPGFLSYCCIRRINIKIASVLEPNHTLYSFKQGIKLFMHQIRNQYLKISCSTWINIHNIFQGN